MKGITKMVFDVYKTNKNFEVDAIQWDEQYKTLGNI